MPEHFASEFNAILAHENRPLIVGGQAVYLWAYHYAARGASELEQFHPYTSKDADIFVRTPEEAEILSRNSGWHYQANPEHRGPVHGILVDDPAKPDDLKLEITVLRSVTGLSDEDLARDTTIALTPGQKYRLPLPEILLKGKLANLVKFDQAERQDDKHVRMLVSIVRASLAEDIRDAAAKIIDERDVADQLTRTLRIIREPNARRAALNAKIDLEAVFPKIVPTEATPKIARFYSYQLSPAVKPKSRL